MKNQISILLLLFLFSIRLTAQTPISYGQDVSAAIAVLGETDTYSFAGSQGDRIVIRMIGQDDPFGPKIVLKDPMGSIAATASTFGDPARIGVFELQDSGTFLIEASENGNNATGNYGLSLEKVNPAPNSVILDCNLEIMTSPGVPAEINAFSFQVNQGEQLVIRMNGLNSFFDPQIELYDQDGQLVYSDSTNGVIPARINAFEPLPAGTYTLLAMENEGDNTAGYGISIQSVRPECTVSLDCAQDVSASLDSLAEIDAYSLPIGSNDRLIVRMMGEFSSLHPTLELYDPDGNLVQSAGSNGNFAARINALSALGPGTYTLLAMETEGNFTGNYGLSVQALQPACADTIDCSQDLTASLEKLAEIDAYSFRLEQSGNLVIRMIGELSFLDPRIELYDEDGQLVQADSTDGLAPARIGVFDNLPEGDYMLLAMENEGDNTDDYGISIQVLHPGCTVAIGCDEDIPATFDNLAEIDAYSMEVNEDHQFIVRMIGEISALHPRIELYDQGGQLIFADNTNGSIPARIDAFSSLPAGQYIVLTMDNEGKAMGNYGVSVQGIHQGCPGELGCDSDTTGVVAGLAAMSAFGFQAEAGDQALLWLDWAGFSFDLQVELYRPDGTDTAFVLLAGAGPEKTGAIPIYQTGYHTLVFMDEKGNHSGDFSLSLQLLGKDCTRQLGCGEEAHAAFGQLLELDAFSMDVQQGERYLFQYAGESATGVVTLELYRPGDTEPFQTIVSANGQLSRFGPLEAQAEGTHFVLAYSMEAEPGSGYGLSGQILREDCAGPLACGTATTDSIGARAAMDAWFFELPATEHVFIQAKPALTEFSVKMELFREDGTVEPITTEGSELVRISGADGELQAGKYYLILTDQSGSHFSEYGISMQSLETGCAPVLPCNDGVDGELQHHGAMELFTFSAEADELILLSARTESGDEGLVLELFDPQKAPVSIQSGIFPRTGYLSAASGSYYLLVSSSSGDKLSASFGASLVRVPDAACADELEYNESGASGGDHPGELHAWTFDGTAGEKILVRTGNCEPNTDLMLNLHDPDGTLVLEDDSPEEEPVEYELLASGLYTLVSVMEQGSLISLNGMALEKINPGENAPFLQPGDAVSGSFSVPAEMHAYLFEGIQGTALSGQMTTPASGIAPRVLVYAPDGTLAGQSAGAETAVLDEIILPAGGTYTVVVMDQTGCESGNYQVVFDFATGTKEHRQWDPDWNIFPNPTAGPVTIDLALEKGTVAGISVYSATGLQLMSWPELFLAAGKSRVVKDFSGLPSGVYHLRLETEEGVKWGKVVRGDE